MRVLAVGDIHTKIWILEEVEKIMHNYDRVVLLGDYVDDFNAHASQSLETLEKVRQMVSAGVTALMGNHEYHYISDNKYSGYDENTQRLIDERTELQDFVMGLPPIVTYDGVNYSHAGIVEGWDLEDGLGHPNSPLWARPGEVIYKPSAQVVGHTPVETVTRFSGNVWGIDTFSTNRYGNPIGDGTILEVVDGKVGNIIKLGEIE